MRGLTTLCSTLCSLILLLSSVPAAAAGDGPAGSQEPEPTTTPAFHSSGCFTDPVDDVVDAGDGGPAAEPRADIAGWCVDHGTDVISLSLEVQEPTDPATDAGWQDLGAGVAFRFTTGDGTPVVANVVVPPGGRSLEFHVLVDSRVPTTVCSGPAQYDGGRWSASLPVAGCFTGLGGVPDPLEISSAMFYGTAAGEGDAGHTDVAPDGGTLSVPVSAGPAAGVDRFGGAERVATSIEVSVASFADGAADAVVLARQDAFADAVVAAPLAVAAGAPVLLTGQDQVSPSVLMEIRRVLGGAGEVILLGGPAAIRANVAAQLRDEGHRTTRVEGASRFATSVAIAREVSARTGLPPAAILLADGTAFPDALVAGAAAPQLGGVVALTDGPSIPDVVAEYLAEHPDADVIAVGRRAATASPASPAATGATPALTAVAVAELLGPATEVVLASEERFPDGLAGGAYAARRGAPMLLSSRDAMATGVLAHLQEAGPFDAITLLGGTAALGDVVAGQAADHLR